MPEQADQGRLGDEKIVTYLEQLIPLWVDVLTGDATLQQLEDKAAQLKAEFLA